MPDTDMANTLVIGAATGHVRTTKSWVLGRLLRDLDDSLDADMAGEEAHIPPDQEAVAKKPTAVTKSKAWEALRLSVYDVDAYPPCPHGVPVLDWAWVTGLVVIFVQLAISIVPWIIYGDWSAFLITAAGNTLALVEGSLPQWREEKWACTKTGGATVTLTQGNGSRHAIVIKGKRGVGLDLEILAQGTRTFHASRLTRVTIAVLAALWIVFLITVSGIKQNTWCKFRIRLNRNSGNITRYPNYRTPRQHAKHPRCRCYTEAWSSGDSFDLYRNYKSRQSCESAARGGGEAPFRWNIAPKCIFPRWSASQR